MSSGFGIGEIRIDSLKVGSVDLTGTQATQSGFEVFENIFSSYGPAAEINVVDATDAASQLKGGEDVEIRFSDANGLGVVGFKLKSFMSKNLSDRSTDNQGSLKNKQYTIRAVSVEALNAQGNYVDKSWDDKTTNMSKNVLEKYYNTDKQIDIEENSKDKRIFRAQNEHPRKILQKLNDEHVGTSSKSSAFAVFQEQENGNQKYKITTFEKLFEKGSVGKWAQREDLDSSNVTGNDRLYSLIWFEAGENFNMATDHTKKANENTFNLSTHSPSAPKPQQTKFKTLGSPVRETAQYANSVPVSKALSMVNEKQKTEASTAKANKTQFLSHLAENSASFEIIGNPKVKLGCVMDLDIPKKVADGGGKERQFNGKVCVVEIRHKIRPAGQVPRYTMVIRAVKAAYEG